MKNISLLIWMTQLGLSVAVPLAGFILLGVWLHKSLQWGVWTVILGVVLGLLCAFEGLRSSLRAMDQMAKDKKENQPPISFNEHN